MPANSLGKLMCVFSFLIVVPLHAGQGEIEDLADDQVIRLHSVSSAKLREIMQAIHDWKENNTAGDLQQPGLDRELLDGLVEQIEELLYHAELMSMGMPFTNLSRTEMIIFKALGSELYSEALYIRQLVHNQETRYLGGAYEQMERTCEACHDLFRYE